MKSYIRRILDDMKLGKPTKPQEPVPTDPDNQNLSKDAARRVRQPDWLVQKGEERQCKLSVNSFASDGPESSCQAEPHAEPQ
jgi:hypothetical protein